MTESKRSIVLYILLITLLFIVSSCKNSGNDNRGTKKKEENLQALKL